MDHSHTGVFPAIKLQPSQTTIYIHAHTDTLHARTHLHIFYLKDRTTAHTHTEGEREREAKSEMQHWVLYILFSTKSHSKRLNLQSNMRTHSHFE